MIPNVKPSAVFGRPDNDVAVATENRTAREGEGR